jgi:methionyl-tRNA synthetase
MPEAVSTRGTKPQEIIQFRVQYRYVSKDGKEAPIESFSVDGQQAKASFSNWTEFKTDPEKARETIAISTAYVLVIGTFFAPYLPQLSQSILSYFGVDQKSDLVQKIYRGDLKAMKEFFSKDFKLMVDPQGLVPKIDPKVIEELDKKLKEKATL